MKHFPKIVHNCTHSRHYSARYDSYYCERCDTWVEAKCGDPDCDFCRDRPDRPSLEEKGPSGNPN